MDNTRGHYGTQPIKEEDYIPAIRLVHLCYVMLNPL